MVYRGKPSKACLPCRKRRLLCDLNPAGCASCVRAQIICYGYRDTKALRIADESSIIQARIASNGTASIPPLIHVPRRNQAKDLFYYNYVVGTAQPLDFLQAYYDPCSSEGEHIFRSIDAVALAYLNFQRRDPAIEKESQQHYAVAIKLTRSALKDPYTVKKDSTILSVLLLDMYEKIATAQICQPSSWATHIDGALALVGIRGDKQYQDPTGLRILIRLSTNMVINCVVMNRPINPELIALRQAIASNFPQESDPKWRSSDLMLEWVHLCCQHTDGELSNEALVHHAKVLDAKFEELARSVELLWQYETVEVAHKTRHHFQSYHHFYQSEHYARMWNVLRITRILLNEMICYNCPADDSASFDHGQAIIAEMIEGICATVPQFINGVQMNKEFHTASIRSSVKPGSYPRALSGEEAQIAHHLPTYRLIYPLYVAAQSPLAPAKIKSWIIDQLEFMSDHHGIENAALVVKILLKDSTPDPWQIYRVLGSYAFVC